MDSLIQRPQPEWEYQWSVLVDREAWLFRDWIQPNRLEDFAGKTVLDAGCGPGHHVLLVAPEAKRVVGVDLNTANIAKAKTKHLSNVDIFEGDISSWDNGERFDVVYSVGVIHHCLNPDRAVAHLAELVRPKGRLILWVYSSEGNGLNRFLLEPIKAMLLRHLPRPIILALSHIVTGLLYPIVYTLYRMPFQQLPFYEYFANFRRLSYRRNQLNVFDKLNAPITHFISRGQAESWMTDFSDVHISPYVGVSWRVSGTKAAA